MDLKGKRVLIIGMARSGISAAKMCKELGAKVTIYDSKDNDEIRNATQNLIEQGVKSVFGQLNNNIMNDKELVVLSPGVPVDLEPILYGKKIGIPVISEIELAYRYCAAKIIGITGTNGKTTTTTLVGKIAQAYLKNSKVVGNIGYPFTETVFDVKGEDYVVAELSSFQLETIDRFKPFISAILNITPDHLNRHKTFEKYIEIKERIFENQDENDYTILNYDDPICRKMENKIKGKVIYFSSKSKLRQGVYLDNNRIICSYEDINEEICSIDELKIIGVHNIENIMATIAICICANIKIDIIREQVKLFEGVEHRIEYVATIKGVRYYNDSKATNPDAAIAAINSIKTMNWGTYLIAGGMDKGSDFDEWIGNFDENIKGLIVFGETSNKIKNTAIKLGYTKVEIVNNLEDAIKLSSSLARKEECVLLSPACASWDMLRDYEQRGDMFKQIVKKLEE